MYEQRPALSNTRDLNQGDILRGLLRPKLVTDANLGLLRNRNKFNYPAPANTLHQPDPDLRVVLGVDPLDLSIVVSNSCDNSSDLPLLLAPVRAFLFPPNCQGPEEQWPVISEAATGTANPKLFYLPASLDYGLSRSEVQFSLMFPISHKYLQRCVAEAGTRRLCGLNPEAQRHMQWALGLFFGRNPREDHAWPSREDLELKVKWLEAELSKATGTRYKERYEAELDILKAKLT